MNPIQNSFDALKGHARRMSSVRFLVVAILVLCVGHAAFAQQKNAGRARVKTAAAAQVKPDADSIQASQLRVSPSLKRGNLKQMGQKVILLGSGKKMTLNAVSKIVFDKQNQFAREVGRVEGKAVLKKAEVETVVDEQEDTFVLTQTTRVVVTDPATLKAVSPMYQSMMERPPVKADLNALNADERKFIRELITSAETRDVDDPVRLAAQNGEAAVLQAISDGKGEFEVIDRVVIPKAPVKVVNGKVFLPRIENGALNFKQPLPVQMPTATVVEQGRSSQVQRNVGQSKAVAKVDAKGNIPDAVRDKDAVVAATAKMGDEPKYEVDGTFEVTKEFLAGFTFGQSFLWERKWTFGVGFFRLTFGAGYGIGIRVPIEVDAKMTPTNVLVYDRRDKPLRVDTELRVKTLDADSAFYQRVGLPSDKLFDGNEFVLEFQTGFGYKFRAFGTDVVKKSYTATNGLRFTQNTRPPFGPKCPSCGVDIEIPARLTNTELTFEALKGSLITGVMLNGNAKIRLEKSDIVDEQSKNTRDLLFANQEPLTLQANLGRLSLQNDQSAVNQSYGFELRDLRYEIELFLIPQIRFGFTVGYKSFSRTFKSDWIRFDMLSVGVGTYTLRAHEGTPRMYRTTPGKRRFVKLTPSGNGKDKTKTSNGSPVRTTRSNSKQTNPIVPRRSR
ncbi:MAG: hypothetical protein JXR76_07100 [Deltaproteobacteria bacterium]|nr:hypothetical protein [Deltaproteobacteria bacterium]